jgi:hypothetical protein
LNPDARSSAAAVKAWLLALRDALLDLPSWVVLLLLLLLLLAVRDVVTAGGAGAATAASAADGGDAGEAHASHHWVTALTISSSIASCVAEQQQGTAQAATAQATTASAKYQTSSATKPHPRQHFSPTCMPSTKICIRSCSSPWTFSALLRLCWQADNTWTHSQQSI